MEEGREGRSGGVEAAVWGDPLRAPFDLVTASDVLNYGSTDLSRLFKAVSHALAPGGLFAFSVEVPPPSPLGGSAAVRGVTGRSATAPGNAPAAASAPAMSGSTAGSRGGGEVASPVASDVASKAHRPGQTQMLWNGRIAHSASDVRKWAAAAGMAPVRHLEGVSGRVESRPRGGAGGADVTPIVTPMDIHVFRRQ